MALTSTDSDDFEATCVDDRTNCIQPEQWAGLVIEVKRAVADADPTDVRFRFQVMDPERENDWLEFEMTETEALRLGEFFKAWR